MIYPDFQRTYIINDVRDVYSKLNYSLFMKKLLSLFLVTIITFSAKSQLAQSRWKGSLKLENMTDVVFDFGKDSLIAYIAVDHTPLEAMVYTDKDQTLTIKKVYGQSTCEGILGKYKYEINKEEMVMTLVTDDCYDRSNVLNGTKWTKAK